MSTPICPNFARHCEAGRKAQTYWPAYKTEARENAHRQGFASDQGQCDWCNPPCPTCDTRHRRSDHWLARLALAGAAAPSRNVLALIARAKAISPSDRMTLMVGDVEYALGLRDEPARTRTGANDEAPCEHDWQDETIFDDLPDRLESCVKCSVRRRIKSDGTVLP